jgi:GNAT superfamily N-acetyltransferase
VEWIVAERDGALVGSVILFPAATTTYPGASERVAIPELRVLAVDPASRGQGIGQALVEECIRRARRSGASFLGLHSSSSMREAIAIYERVGFARYPADDFRPSGAELIMAYRLPLGDGASPDESHGS